MKDKTVWDNRLVGNISCNVVRQNNLFDDKYRICWNTLYQSTHNDDNQPSDFFMKPETSKSVDARAY